VGEESHPHTASYETVVRKSKLSMSTMTTPALITLTAQSARLWLEGWDREIQARDSSEMDTRIAVREVRSGV